MQVMDIDGSPHRTFEDTQVPCILFTEHVLHGRLLPCMKKELSLLDKLQLTAGYWSRARVNPNGEPTGPLLERVGPT